ncbi:hypothetical protein HanRHA438_Chr11g0506841 [Helianthus annuus]|nr:hypothetical protein HanRHA438_Chr11g0506841 [Helianthus annuus]
MCDTSIFYIKLKCISVVQLFYVQVWFNFFMFCFKFCKLIRRNVHVWFNVFTSIFPCLTGSSQHTNPRSSQCWWSITVV